MTDLAPRLGDVWRYPFLWSREAASGETEGRKERPVVLALLVRNRIDEMVLLMVPITSVPQSDRYAIEVPEIEKRRAGLDAHMRLWIVADEANEDIPARSFYFESGNRIGQFSAPFTKQVQAVMIEALKAKRLQRTGRG
ncbi:hypothetical protein GCM10007989_13930 [Devosia pacifica]|jgi:uncharacterized protein YifN (PemK superfamily)|uniref:PemK-like, MazF-like toxin of type II toxin-antitoxin system n=1 Tax=Devosia pacifica TaxID=1335967 RepID=A0A918S276_9HYPH|nr:hypothetical protein [Devosia pacifica]GHA19553.1 hypothetical protein GCM10007989_13930 [Devosia pacifica]|tara:strand:- start:3330 stop:3746 length:417 start_codon:yes stop_codon:yes gene_type:complete